MDSEREIDREVAERVMGWTNFHQERHGEEYISFGKPPGSTLDCVPCPRYSTSIEAAWSVVEKMRETHSSRLWAMDSKSQPEPGRQWLAEFVLPFVSAVRPVYADTAPMAICLAALKALPTPTRPE